VHVYVKVESFNPMGSVKDRLAFAIINDAEEAGDLQPGQTVVEATSGNTGIALAMVCAAIEDQPGFIADDRELRRAGPSYTVLTVRGGWQIAERTRLSLALENLTDEDYRVHGSGLNEPGRNAVLTLFWNN